MPPHAIDHYGQNTPMSHKNRISYIRKPEIILLFFARSQMPTVARNNSHGFVNSLFPMKFFPAQGNKQQFRLSQPDDIVGV